MKEKDSGPRSNLHFIVEDMNEKAQSRDGGGVTSGFLLKVQELGKP